MFRIIRRFFQQRIGGYPDSGAKAWRGEKPFDLLESASHILDRFTKSDDGRDAMSQAIRVAARAITEKIGFEKSLADMFAVKSTMPLLAAGRAAEQLAETFHVDSDPSDRMVSEAYSLIAILCYGYLGRYRGTEGQRVFETGSLIFGSISAMDRATEA